MAWAVDWRVEIDGQDVSGGMLPWLTSIEVNDKDGTASDTATLTFADPHGQSILPDADMSVAIFLSGVKVFAGTLDAPRFTFARGQGRTLSVSAKGVDVKGKAKQRLSFHKDDATLQDFLGDAAKRAGQKAPKLDPAFASIKRPYWSAQGESFLHLGERLARELGGTFKVRSGQPVLAKRGEGKSPDGQAMPTVTATIGERGNVLSCDVTPRRGRPAYAKARVRYFDRKAAAFKQQDVEIQGENGEALSLPGGDAADEGSAKDAAGGRKSDADREGGSGSVRILFDVAAQAEGTLNLSGAREGVDGTYRIVSVTHKLDRSGGAETSLEIKQPQDGAGKDPRGKT